MRSIRWCAALLALSAASGCTFSPDDVGESPWRGCETGTPADAPCDSPLADGAAELHALAAQMTECVDGPCCDGGRFVTNGTVCEVAAESSYDCSSDACGASTIVTTRDRLCSGTSDACDGGFGEWSRPLVHDACAGGEVCVPGQAECVTCDLGEVCVDGACQEPCECSTGPCCDGCYLLAAGTRCAEQAAIETGCPWGQGCGSAVGFRSRDQMCTGESALCDGELGPWSTWDVDQECDSTTACGGDTPGCGYAALCNCELQHDAEPAWPVFTDPEGFFDVRARAQVDGGVARVELHRGDGGAFSQPGRMLIFDLDLTLVAEADYLAGASEVHLVVDVPEVLGVASERGLVVMAEPQGSTCPAGAGCRAAIRNYGVDACGEGSSVCLRQACAD